MSINVTVKGNPVSIKHGKMVTVDSDYTKKEFDKRRKIRLEQVRQQSKEIAEDVRNKVRREKDKQLSKVEREGATKLKQWQNKKLLQLQNQYEECLKDIGLGHSQAVTEEQSEENIISRNEESREIAKERGVKAEQKLQTEKNEKNMKKAATSQSRTLSRDIENTRASMVSKLNKRNKTPSKKKKKKKVEESASETNAINVVENSESDSDVPVLLNISSGDSSSSSGVPSKLPRRRSPSISSPTALSDISEKETKTSSTSARKKEVAPKGSCSPDCGRQNFPLDTRISDRIKSRSSRSEFNKNAPNAHKQSKPSTSTNLENVATSTKLNPESLANFNFLEDAKVHPERYCGLNGPCHRQQAPPQEIPCKPTICLKPTQQGSAQVLPEGSNAPEQNKVQYYDHSNRFSKEYVPDRNVVQKISDESLQVCPSSGNDAEYLQTVYRRDREAQERGQKALEKEKIRKDYEDLIRKLPVLEKQERLATISSSKISHHMSEDRLKELQRRNQDRIESAYEKSFPLPKSNVITIPRRQHEKMPSSDDPPYQTVDINGSPPSLNVASWDVNYRKSSMEDGQENSSRVARTDNLVNILEKLKAHRESLLREVEHLPENSNLHRILQELSAYGNQQETATDESLKHSKKRKHDLVSKGTTIGSSFYNSSPSSDPSAGMSKKKQSTGAAKTHDEIKKKVKQKKPKQIVESCTSPTSDDVPIRHRIKERIILQNMSTQTSPKPEEKQLIDYSDETDKNLLERVTSQPEDEEKIKRPCDCDTKKEDTSEQVCEIIIKIAEDVASPEIKVGPNYSKTKIVKSYEDRKEIKPDKPDKPKEKKRPSIFDKLGKFHEANKQSEESKPTSWAEHLVNSKDFEDSAATSYYSPPGYGKDKSDVPPSKPSSSTAKAKGAQKSAGVTPSPASVSKDRPTSTFSEFLRQKPQQSNVETQSTSTWSRCKCDVKKLDPRLKIYIAKLLAMTRMNIDDLGVSTGSEVTTPATSIIETESNNPRQQLSNVMKFFNLTTEDLKKIVNETDSTLFSSCCASNTSVSSEATAPSRIPSFLNEAQAKFFENGLSSVKNKGKHVKQKESLNANESRPVTSKHSAMADAMLARTSNIKSPAEIHVEDYDQSSSRSTNVSTRKSGGSPRGILKSDEQIFTSTQTEDASKSNKSLLSPSNHKKQEDVHFKNTDLSTNKSVNTSSTLNMSVAEYSQKFYPEAMDKYSEIAERCHKRIENLERLIEKVRKEKKDMLESPHASESEIEISRTYYKELPSQLGKQISDGGSLNDAEQEKLNQHLLKIDYELTEKIKVVREAEMKNFKEVALTTAISDIDPHLLERYRKLLELELPKDKQHKEEIGYVTIEPQKQITDVPFIPLLLDIPRLPKLPTNIAHDDPITTKNVGLTKPKRPPPSKAFVAAQKFIESISGYPHELSTIVEGDSIVSAKPSLLAPQEPQQNVKITEIIETEPKLNDKIISGSEAEHKSSTLSDSSDESISRILTELVKNATQENFGVQIKDAAPIENKNLAKTNTKRAISPKSTSSSRNIDTSDTSTDKSELETLETMLETLGMGWAITTLRKTKKALAHTSSTSSLDISFKKKEIKLSDSSSSSSEVMLRGMQLITKLASSSSDSEILKLMKDIGDISAIQGSGASAENKNQRTSTPVLPSRSDSKSKTNSQVLLFTGESDLSSVRANDDNFASLAIESSSTVLSAND